MADDWYCDLIDQVESAGAELHRALDHIVGMLLTARQERVDGVPLPTIVMKLSERGERDTRRSNEHAFRAFSAAMTAYRAASIRALVDELGMTHAEVARVFGISRQMVGRLYQYEPDAPSEFALQGEGD